MRKWAERFNGKQRGRFQFWILHNGAIGIKIHKDSIVLNFWLFTLFYNLNPKEYSLKEKRYFGLSYFDGYFTFEINDKTIFYKPAPWTFVHQYTIYHNHDGSEALRGYDWDKREATAKDRQFDIKFSFTQSGEIINAKGTAEYRTMVFRLKRFPLFKEYIDIDFSWDEEMGPRRGSWKGGTIGTSEQLSIKTCLYYQLNSFHDWNNVSAIYEALSKVCQRCGSKLLNVEVSK